MAAVLVREGESVVSWAGGFEVGREVEGGHVVVGGQAASSKNDASCLRPTPPRLQ